MAHFSFYLDRLSRPMATFAGRRLRILPIGFGSATHVRSTGDEELEGSSFKLLFGTKCQGQGGVEFKKDPRDEQYKLIEFNLRFRLRDTLSIRCGIDIAKTAHCDALGLPVEATRDYREGVRWVDLERDVRAFLTYNRQQRMSFGDWLP